MIGKDIHRIDTKRYLLEFFLLEYLPVHSVILDLFNMFGFEVLCTKTQKDGFDCM